MSVVKSVIQAMLTHTTEDREQASVKQMFRFMNEDDFQTVEAKLEPATLRNLKSVAEKIRTYDNTDDADLEYREELALATMSEKIAQYVVERIGRAPRSQVESDWYENLMAEATLRARGWRK